MLVRYDCGCVGIPWGDDKALLMAPCDADADTPYTFYVRKMYGKSWTKVDNRDAEMYVTQIGKLVADGLDLQAVRSIINRR